MWKNKDMYACIAETSCYTLKHNIVKELYLQKKKKKERKKEREKK